MVHDTQCVEKQQRHTYRHRNSDDRCDRAGWNVDSFDNHNNCVRFAARDQIARRINKVACSAFPTPFTNIPNQYQWFATSGTYNGSTHTMMMPTAVMYTPANVTIPAIPTDDPRGLGWNLALIGVAADPSQIRWLRSVYSDATWLRECKPTQVLEKVGRPPIAMQALSLIARPEVTGAAGTDTSTEGDVETILTIAPPKTASEKATMTEHGEQARHRPNTTSGASPSSRASAPVPSKVAYGASSDSEYATSTSVELETPQTQEGSKSAAAPNNQSGSQQPSLATAVPHTRPNGSPEVSSSNAPEPSSASSPGESASAVSELAISVQSGHVVLSDTTLSINKTVTLGSGSIVTNIALETDAAGKTVVVQGVVTSLGSQLPQITGSYTAGSLGSVTHIVYEAATSSKSRPSSSPPPSLTNVGNEFGRLRNGGMMVLAVSFAVLVHLWK